MPYSCAGGARIYYEVSGEGRPMVLVHANPFDHNLWMYQIAHFSTWFRVTAVDIRGYGRSDKVATPFTLKDLADDIVGVIDQESSEPVVLCGCSVGSRIAQCLTLDHPKKVAALVLVGGNSARSSRYQKRIDGYTGPDLRAYQRAHMHQLFGPGFVDSALGRHLLETFAERSPRLSGEAIAQVFHAGNSTDLTARLPTISVPTLVVNGEYDHSLPAGTKTAQLIPGAIHRILPGAGHACCLEDPAGFDDLLVDFLTHAGLLPALS